MSQKEDAEASEHDKDSDEDRDSDTGIESEREPAPARRAAVTRAGKPAVAAAKGAEVPASRVGLFVILALAAGGAAGWFGHIQQAKAAVAKADAAAPVGSSGAVSGPCRTWEDKICSSSGQQSAACQQAKGAAELLTPSTCTAGLAVMPATLTKLKAARASCDKLVGKLCSDLPPGSQTCTMVKERTPSFPAQRCDEMLQHYDEVLTPLKQMDQQGGPQMGGPGGPGHGGPGHGGPGPVMPPH